MTNHHIFNLVGQVEARRVMHETAAEVAAWCAGAATWVKWVSPGEEIATPQSFSGITLYVNDCTIEANPGDWVVKTAAGHLVVFTDSAFRESIVEDADTGFERWRVEKGRAAARDFMERLTQWREQVAGGARVVSGAGLIHDPKCASIRSIVEAYQREAQMILNGDQRVANEWAGWGRPSLPDLATKSRVEALTRSGVRWCGTCEAKAVNK